MTFKGVASRSSRSYFWIHLLAYEPRYELLFMRPLLHHIFKFFRNVEFLLLVLPPGVQRVDCLQEFATRVLPLGNTRHRWRHHSMSLWLLECKDATRCQSLYRVASSSILASYTVRRAVVEDNDDLVPLIDNYSKRLVALYGSFYIAELLTAGGVASRHIVVAEHAGVAVSVMVLNDVANYELLNEEFELTPFNGLRKRSDDDDIELQTLSQAEVILSNE